MWFACIFFFTMSSPCPSKAWWVVCIETDVCARVRKALVSLTLPARISNEFKGERKMHYGPAALGFRLGWSRRRGFLGSPTVTLLDLGQDTFHCLCFPAWK